jgi:hypothetical protein
MRKPERLLPILVLVLLTSVVLARPARSGVTGRGLRVAAAQSRFCAGVLAREDPRLDFGTVVRDTADEQSIEPGSRELPSVLRQQSLPGWTWFFIRSWISDLLPR